MAEAAPRHMLSIAEVTAATSLCRATIYNLVNAGRFPRQVRLSRNRVAWRASEVDAWLESPRIE